MKKRVLIGCAAALAAAGVIVFRICTAQSSASVMIRKSLSGVGVVPEAVLRDYDLNQDGKVDRMDWLQAKAGAVFSGEEALYPQFFTADKAKQLGRTAYHQETKTDWCSLSGSGISFGFYGKECMLYLTADNAFAQGEKEAARYAVYLNDTLIADSQLTEQEQSVRIVNTGSEDAPAWVRFVKLSESANSSLGIREICIASSKQTFHSMIDGVFCPAKNSERYIEFIGDSITCGYGVDGENGKDAFTTANENVTKAYAYLTAQALGADYSMVSYSGHGIISGYTTNGKAQTGHLVPRYYGQVGHCPAVIEERHKIQDDLWDFARQPDAVVINLGTNDASYTGTDTAKQKDFAAAYAEFLKTVREKNPDARIVCALGTMGQTLCDAVALAAQQYTKETGDTNITTFRFAEQLPADGYGVDWHPSAATHEKAAEALTAFLREQLEW